MAAAAGFEPTSMAMTGKYDMLLLSRNNGTEGEA